MISDQIICFGRFLTVRRKANSGIQICSNGVELQNFESFIEDAPQRLIDSITRAWMRIHQIYFHTQFNFLVSPPSSNLMDLMNICQIS